MPVVQSYMEDQLRKVSHFLIQEVFVKHNHHPQSTALHMSTEHLFVGLRISMLEKTKLTVEVSSAISSMLCGPA